MIFNPKMDIIVKKEFEEKMARSKKENDAIIKQQHLNWKKQAKKWRKANDNYK